MAGSYDGSVRIDTRVDSKGFNNGMGGMTASLGKFAAAVGLAFGVAAVVNFGRSAVQAASTLASAMTGLQSIMNGQGRSFSEAQAFITKYTEDGLVPATNAIIAYKNLALRGYDTSQIEGIMSRLKDSAAFARTSSYTMGEAIQMASEGLKNENSILVDNAGVTKNVAMMWRDYAQSIGTTAANLTLAQKRQAEFNGIMEETRFQVGDAAKLSGEYAGKVSALWASFINLKVAVGNAIIPISNQIIPYVKAAIDWLVVLFNTVARVMNLLFHTNVSMVDLEETATDVGDNLGGAAGDAQDLADGTEAAAEAAKGALASFDELNVLQMDEATDSGGGGDTGVPGLVETPTEPTEEPDTTVLDEWAAKIEEIKERILTALQPTIDAFDKLMKALEPLKNFVFWGLIDFYYLFLKPVGEWVLGEGLPRFIDGITTLAENVDWTTLNGALFNLWTSLEPFVLNIGEGLLWFYENVLIPLATWALDTLVPATLDLVSAALDALNIVIEALKPLGKWLWEEFLKPVGEWAGTVIIDGINWLTDAFTRLSDWIKENQTMVELIAIVLGSIAAAILLVNIALAVYNVVAGIAAAVTTLLASPILLVVLAIAAIIAIVIICIRYWDDIKAAAVTAWDKIKETWEIVSTWFSENVVEPVKKWFKEAWEDIQGFFTGAWDGIVLIWGVVATWFQDNIIDPITTAWETFTDALSTAWETVWNGIESIVKGVINTVIGFINGFISAVVNGINAVIGALNSIQIDIPEWVPVLGGTTFGISLNLLTAPQIPLLASGAVIPPNSAFLAVLGDQRSGRNIEAPENLIRGRDRRAGDGHPDQLRGDAGGVGEGAAAAHHA